MGECLIMRRGGETYKLPVLNASYPKDVTTTVIKGNTTSATFTVNISEAGNPATYTYQWYVNGSKVSGATSSSYTRSDLSTTATYSVYCEITNKAGTVQTRVATLKVTQYYTPVLNSSYPADVTGVTVGGSATFKVTIATAGVPASYSYQWYVNGSAVSGATSSSYTRSNLAVGSYTVYCKVSNSAGTVQSRTAKLTVTTQYLYNAGTISDKVGSLVQTGVKYGGVSGSCTLKQNTTNVTVGSYGGQGALVYFSKKFDITNYKKLCFNGSVVNRKTGSPQKCGIGVWKAIPTNNAGTEASAIMEGARADGTHELNIENCTGEHYIGIAVQGYGTASDPYVLATMKQMWLLG